MTTPIPLMNWKIPIDYTIPTCIPKNTNEEQTIREDIIFNFLQDNTDDDTKVLATEIFLNNKNMFITGWGGTGKSYQMKLMYNLATLIYSTNIQSVILCSTTGSSALNLGIPEATTINSWSGILIEDRPYRKIVNGEFECCEDEGKNYLKYINNKIKNTKILFIDEISMLGGYFMKILDSICKQVKSSPLPFGGIQLVLFGDMLQLPPVKDVLCFTYKVWCHLGLQTHRLVKCHRHDNEVWANMLGKIRVANVYKKNGNMMTTLDINNINLIKTRSTTKSEDVPSHCLWLYSKNIDASNHNKKCLDAIRDEVSHVNVSIDKITVQNKNTRILTLKESDEDINWTCELNSNSKSKKSVSSVLKEVDIEFIFKIGARVMCKKNIHKKSGIVNGARGIITDFKYVDKQLSSILVNFSYRNTGSVNGCTEVDFQDSDGNSFVSNEWFKAISRTEAWFFVYYNFHLLYRGL